MTAASPAEATRDEHSTHDAARLHLVTAASLSFVGVAALGLAWLQLAAPDLAQGVSFLSYGRLRPAAVHLVVFGGAVPAVLGLASYAAAASAGRRPAWELASLAAWLAVTVGAVGGAVGILIGDGQGFAWFDAPLYGDFLLGAGMAVATVSITRTLRNTASNIPATWFLVGSAWWLLGAFLVGNIPDVGGVNATIQNGFAVAVLVGPGLLGGAIGAGYLALGALLDRQLSSRLGWIAFWSLGFFAPWVGQRFSVHGPGPDWLETIAVVFSVGLFLPVLTVLADWVRSGRDRWGDVAGFVTGKFFIVGMFLLAVYPVHNLVMALRSSGAVLQFTAWTEATMVLVVLGAAGFLITAAVYVVRPQVSGRAWIPEFGATHFWLSGIAVAVILVALWLEGLQQGYGWVGAVNSAEVANLGEQFRASVEPLRGWLWARGAGAELLAVGTLAFLLRVAWSEVSGGVHWRDVDAAAAALEEDIEEDEVVAPIDAAPPMRSGRLVWGSLGLFGLAVFTVLMLPFAESANSEASLLAEGRDPETSTLRAEGYRLYISEGCIYCHTQQVRAVVTDVGLGPVTQPGDYALDDVPVAGVARVGPDLSFSGRREPTRSVRWVEQHLVDPRRADTADVRRPWSNMPSYGYLSQGEVAALAAYVAGLE